VASARGRQDYRLHHRRRPRHRPRQCLSAWSV